HPVFAHGGGNHGFTCNMACAADGSVGAVAMTNSIEGTAVADEILRLVGASRGVELSPVLDWAGEAARAMEQAGDPVPGGDGAVAGTYALGEVPITVEVRGNDLRITFADQPPLAFYRRAGHWGAGAVEAAVRFVDGALVVRQFGRE